MAYVRVTWVVHVIVSTFAVALATLGQSPVGNKAPPSSDIVAQTPEFEVATIKPINPGHGHFGFISLPSGKIDIGSETVKGLIALAFDVDEYRVSGGPGWTGTDRYDVFALTPGELQPHTDKPRTTYIPTDMQRALLQALLSQRFGLKVHRASKIGPVYILTRGEKPLQMQDSKDKDRNPAAAVFIKGDVIDGEAAGLNASMPFLAKQLSVFWDRPVLDQTGLKGTYDFHIPPDDPSNHDLTLGFFKAMERLGLKLESGKGPIDTIVIDSVSKPTEN